MADPIILEASFFSKDPPLVIVPKKILFDAMAAHLKFNVKKITVSEITADIFVASLTLEVPDTTFIQSDENSAALLAGEPTSKELIFYGDWLPCTQKAIDSSYEAAITYFKKTTNLRFDDDNLEALVRTRRSLTAATNWADMLQESCEKREALLLKTLKENELSKMKLKEALLSVCQKHISIVSMANLSGTMDDIGLSSPRITDMQRLSSELTDVIDRLTLL